MRTVAIPIITPNNMPASTSVGKCRNIYSLLKAITAATTKTAIPAFLYFMNMVVAAANAHAECVDGNDELEGLFTRRANV
jgi:hypothetical protein